MRRHAAQRDTRVIGCAISARAGGWRMRGVSVVVTAVHVMCAGRRRAARRRRARAGRRGPAARPGRSDRHVGVDRHRRLAVADDHAAERRTSPACRSTREGRKVAASWDLAADEAAGNQCKAFGIGGIMRQPGRVRISWQDDNTLKLEFDAGHADASAALRSDGGAARREDLAGIFARRVGGPGSGPRRRAGDGRTIRASPAAACWIAACRAAAARACAADRRRAAGADQRGGSLKVVTTQLPRGLPAEEWRALQRAARRSPSTSTGCRRIPTATTGCTSSRSSTIRDTCRSRSTRARISASKRTTPQFKPTPCQTAPPLPVTKK